MVQASDPEPLATLRADLTAKGITASSDAQDLLFGVARLASRPNVSAMLEMVCEDPELLARCAQNSLKHPLGFDKIVLFKLNALEIQLHVWWPEADVRQEHVHNHRFRFCSSILAGQLRAHEYVVAEAGTLMSEFREHRDRDNAEFILEPRGKAWVQLCKVAELGPGSTYFQPADVLHRVSVQAGALTATLFVKLSSRDRTTTSVFVDAALGEPPRASRKPFTPDGVTNRLDRLLEALPVG